MTGGVFKPCSTSRSLHISATIIWPTLALMLSSCTINSRPVLRSDDATASLSQGAIERRSMSSTSRFESIDSRVCSTSSTQFPQVTNVSRLPDRTRRACPSGIASTAVGAGNSAHIRCLGSRIMVGSSPCSAVQNRPAASPGVDGTTTRMPGMRAKDASPA